MIYLVTKTLNRIDNFKMFKDKYGYLCAWDKIIPNYTIFHNDDHTFLIAGQIFPKILIYFIKIS